MDSNPDKRSLNLFMIVMGFVAVAIVLILLANYFTGKTQEVRIPDEIAEHQKTPAQVEPVSPAPDAATLETAAAAATTEPVAAVLSGAEVYNQACMACHGAAIAGAPKTGDTAAWASRLSQGNETLREHVINGYQGSAGYMPPKGGRVDLSDDEIFAAMDFMLEQVR